MWPEWYHLDKLPHERGSNRMEIGRNRQLAFDVEIAARSSSAARDTINRIFSWDFNWNLSHTFATISSSSHLLITLWIKTDVNFPWKSRSNIMYRWYSESKYVYLTWRRTASENDGRAKYAIKNGPDDLHCRNPYQIGGGIDERLIGSIRCQNAIWKWYADAEHNLNTQRCLSHSCCFIDLQKFLTWIDQQALILSMTSLRWSCIPHKCRTKSAAFQSLKIIASILYSVRKLSLNCGN